MMKMCEQILKKKKKTAPQYNSNSLNCKNQEHRNIATLSLQLRSYKNHSNKIDLKKGLLQYSSSSRKKDFSNTPLRVVKIGAL